MARKCNRIAATGGEDKKVNLWTLSKPTCIMVFVFLFIDF